MNNVNIYLKIFTMDLILESVINQRNTAESETELTIKSQILLF